jgi:hypothetical protein
MSETMSMRRRATQWELEQRLTKVAEALQRGWPASTVIQRAVEVFGVNRRTAQRYVRMIHTSERPLVQAARSRAQEGGQPHRDANRRGE